jgi:DNA-binding Xre family transcriptional regulator
MAVRWRLKVIAEPERWTARKIAEATGLAYNTVWGIWANKSKRADLDTLDTLSKLLKVEPGALVERVPDQDSPRQREVRT